MKIIQKLTIWFIAFLVTMVLTVQVGAQSKGQRAGNAGAAELLIPVGSVGSALGGANLATSTGIEAIHWNVAGMAVIADKAEVMVSNLNYIAGVDVNYAAGAFKIGDGNAIGVSLKTLSFGDIAVTNSESPDGTGETFSPNYITVGLSYSRLMTDKINFGVTAKLVSERILRENATGVAFDFGIQYNTSFGLGFGIALKNIGPNMKFSGNDLEVLTGEQAQRPDAEKENFRIPLANFELPTTLELGVAYRAGLSGNNNITFMGTFLNNNFGFDEYKLAAEYSLNDIVFLRGSYVLAWDADQSKLRSSDQDFLFGPSFGGGLQFGLGSNINLQVDYAYRVTELFDDNQWFSVRIGF